MNPQVIAAISHIPGDAWTPIAYPNAIWAEAESRWISLGTERPHLRQWRQRGW